MTKKDPLSAKAEKAAKAVMIDARDEQCFWVNFGPVVKNLAELKTAVEEMSDEQFAYHTKRDGNDFARWVEDIFNQAKLAAKLTLAKDRKDFAKILGKKLDK